MVAHLTGTQVAVSAGRAFSDPAVVRSIANSRVMGEKRLRKTVRRGGHDMSIRIGLIGAGIMGADHARIFARELPGAELRVICDADQARARRLADSLGVADVASDGEAVIARADVDAIVIASPDFTHAPLSLAAIRAGKPALCEKPLSQSAKQCLEVVAAEGAAGRHLIQVGFMRRFDQSYVEIKQALDQRVVGRALMMHNFHRNVETPASDFTGAMAITNSAPHELDVARFVLDTDYRTVTAFQPRRSDALVAPVVMVLETVDDQLVTIEINNNASYGYDACAANWWRAPCRCKSPPIAGSMPA